MLAAHRSFNGPFRTNPELRWLMVLLGCNGRRRRALLSVALMSGCGFFHGLAWAADATSFSQEDLDYFESRVRPILAERCLSCHGEDEDAVEGELRLTSRGGVLKGGASGPAAVASKPDGSLLLEAVSYRGALQMPPDGKLSDGEIDVLTQWVIRGLPWPPETEQRSEGTHPAAEFAITAEQRNFWAFQPPVKRDPPEVDGGDWAANAIDRFILAKLNEADLRPAPPADRRALIRRATFDLIGLPPTPEETEAFVNDSAPDAYAKVIDRLLASPQYGERWGRHWLDLVRYTDSFDSRIADGASPFDCNAAWRYRDWVVDALNRDLPYDEFVKQQIAGDLLPAADGSSVNVTGTVATVMLALGNWGGGDADKEKLLTDIADDQVDVVSRAFLGLTVACARCHDHKFDPISTADYYGLAGIFMSTHILSDVGPKGGSPSMLRVSLETEATQREKAEYEARVATVSKELEELRSREFAKLSEQLVGDVERYLTAAWEYVHWADVQSRPSVEEFAAEHQVEAFALRNWMDALERSQGSLLSTRVDSLLGKPGLIAWRGAADTPSLVANANAEPIGFLSIQMPPRSVAIHPAPSSGVMVQWRAPQAGTYKIVGSLKDGDGNCGNGVDWAVAIGRRAVETQLAGGSIDNGGQQAFGENDAALSEVVLGVGDSVSIAVLPRGEHSCDTTIVDLTITEKASGRVWNLAGDLLADPATSARSNPHPDAQGTPDVWRFLDLAGATSSPLVNDATLRAWYEVAAQDDGSEAAKAEAARAASAVQQAVDRGKQSPIAAENDPAGATYRFLVSKDAPFWGDGRGGEALLDATSQAALKRLSSELASLRAQPPVDPGYSHGCSEGGCPNTSQAGIHDVRIHLRGRYDRLGPVVPRRFPEVLAGNEQPPINDGSGRRQLAEWIAEPTHPLTARVMVNRLWQHHFGEGLVRTPSNFGKLGETPTHPELLDWLAVQFVESGWSMKATHRLMMLSATYQQSSAASAAALEKDGDNRLLARMSRRRLDAEQLRDSLLAVTGELDTALGGVSTRDMNSSRRTLYLMTIRSDRTSFRDLFDGADSTAIIDKRTVSTVAPQALFMMNHPFVQERAAKLAERALASDADEGARVDQLYEWLFSRPADEREREVAASLLAVWRQPQEGAAADAKTIEQNAWRQYCQVLLCSNEFAFVD